MSVSVDVGWLIENVFGKYSQKPNNENFVDFDNAKYRVRR
jgi:hypothetical protein